MEKPIISLFGPGIKTDLWMRLYASLISNKVPWELILVGDHQPDFELPENFRFIYSKVKPAQCVEIGARHSIGELIMSMGDDLIFSDGALDDLYRQFTSLADDKTIVSCRFFFAGHEQTARNHYFQGQTNTPILPFGALLKRDLWMRLGGLDRRFIASFYDFDMAMRIYEVGGQTIISKDAVTNEVHKGPRLVLEYGEPFDRPLLHSFWVKDGRIVKNRLSPLEPFTDDDILTVSQGNKGRWP